MVPAIAAMTTTPIAHREIEVVTRSQTSSQRTSSPGISTLPNAAFSLTTSVSRNMQMKMIVKATRKMETKSPAMPSTAEIASGTAAETSSPPDCTFSAAPLSPSQPESSSDSRSCSIVCGRSWRKSRTAPTSGTRNNSPTTSTARAVPSTVTAEAMPRERCVFAITHRNGASNTSARKIPTKTTRNVSPIAQNAPITARVAATSNTVRIGRSNALAGTSPTCV